MVIVEVLYEQYSNTINIEGLATLDIAKKQIVPAVMKYQRKLANGVAELKTVGVDSSVQEKLLEDITANLKDLFVAIKLQSKEYSRSSGIRKRSTGTLLIMTQSLQI